MTAQNPSSPSPQSKLRGLCQCPSWTLPCYHNITHCSVTGLRAGFGIPFIGTKSIFNLGFLFSLTSINIEQQLKITSPSSPGTSRRLLNGSIFRSFVILPVYYRHEYTVTALLLAVMKIFRHARNPVIEILHIYSRHGILASLTLCVSLAG